MEHDQVESALSMKVSDAARKVAIAQSEHQQCLRELRKYRMSKAKMADRGSD